MGRGRLLVDAHDRVMAGSIALITIGCLLTVWNASSPGGDILLQLLTLGLFAAPLAWLGRLAAFVWDRARGRRNARLATRLAVWTVEPCILLLTLLVCTRGWPLLWRFHASEG